MNKATIVILLFLLSSCGPSWHLKQSKRHKLKAIQLGAVVKTDTVFVNVPVFIKEISKDTLFLSKPGDTVVITKDRLKVKYVDLPGDSVFIEGKCIADTLKILVPTTVTEVVHAEKSWMGKWWIFLLVGFAVGIMLSLWLRR